MRIKQLDILRGAAILLVLLHHLPAPKSVAWWGVVLVRVKSLGWVGVDLFFVLSGLLIGGLLLGEWGQFGGVNIRRFYLRRAFKLYPGFYTLLAITVAVGLTFGVGPTFWRGAVLSEMLFLQNYLHRVYVHTWSLAVEEHFYLVLPWGLIVLFAACRRWKWDAVRAASWCFGGMAVVLLAMRCWSLSAEWDPRVHHWPTHLRIDSLSFGVLLALVRRDRGEWLAGWVRRWKRAILAVSVGLVAPAWFLKLSSPFMHSVGFTMLFVGFGGVLLLSLYGSGSERKSLRWCGDGLAYIGTYSYSIYLWHMAPVYWVVPLAERSLGVTLGYGTVCVFMLIGSVVLGVAAAKVVEFPLLRLRDRWFPSRSGSVGVIGLVDERKSESALERGLARAA
jgi:peptidoglycan/LPS O-acetylase OafA/YrhL